MNTICFSIIVHVVFYAGYLSLTKATKCIMDIAYYKHATRYDKFDVYDHHIISVCFTIRYLCIGLFHPTLICKDILSYINIQRHTV